MRLKSGALFMLAVVMAGSKCAATDVFDTAAYTIKVIMESQWLTAEGRVLSSNMICCSIGIDSTRALIQPWCCDQDTNLVFFTWATSPFRTNEWIVGAQSRGPQDSLGNVFINDHPVLGAQDTYVNLARILYLPASHPTYNGIPANERLYIPIESSLYGPEEIEFRTSGMAFGGSSGISSVEAVTAPYYYRPMVGTNRIRSPFREPPATRKLWTIAIPETTNWHGITLPSRFNYTRYQDPDLRATREDLRPIVSVTGWLASAELGAQTDIRPRLSRELSLADVRVTPILGRAVRYPSTPGGWPEMNSKEFDQLIETNRPLVAQSLRFEPAYTPKRKVARLVILAILVLTPVPIFVLHRFSSCNRNNNA